MSNKLLKLHHNLQKRTHFFKLILTSVHGDLSGGGVLAAVEQRLLQVLVVDVLADEHHLALAQLSLRKGAVAGPEIDLFVHTLEDELGVTLIGESQHSLGAVEIRGLGLQQSTHEGVKEGYVKKTHNCEADGGDQGQVVSLLFLLEGRRGVTVIVLVAVLVAVIVIYVPQ